jgi:outer membrane immunogenic protein
VLDHRFEFERHQNEKDSGIDDCRSDAAGGFAGRTGGRSAAKGLRAAALRRRNGLRLGANGGYASNRACWGSFGAGLVAEGCNSKSGGVLGGQGGYRVQAGQFVFGVEAEGDWANMRASLPSVLVPGGTDSTKVTSVGLFTGQIGYAVNAALFYLKGGAALANNNFLIQNAAGTGLYYATSHKLGATVGVGFEYGFTPNWTAGIEYDRLMMGNNNNSFSVPAGAAAAANTVSQNIDMVTLRINYKFGGHY